MRGFADHAAAAARMLAATPGWQRLCALRPELDAATAAAILDEAAKLAEGVLAPLNRPADRQGCRLIDGRVAVPDGFAHAYRAMGAAGWLAMDVPERLGGQGLPTALQVACQPLFESACMAFMMAPGASRAAAHLLAAVADARLAQEWVPRLADGSWAATICISEPEAGSDVGRIRSRAVRTAQGWRVSGRKMWISFGDHTMTGRIGHCLLARTDSAPGSRGLSLFLVPDSTDAGARNGVTVDRIEEKLGLHGSPTCALGFEESEAILLGEEGRGLPQLFAMIQHMRLLTGGQGLGIAAGVTALARSYAGDRRQGGPAEAPPLPLDAHADVRRQLLTMAARTELLRAALLELACAMDLAVTEPDPETRTAHAVFVDWMLPLAKTFGAETGFDVAHAALQVLGGAGYTTEWPVEQALRDIRVAAIYEGTTGMQAQDFLLRRLWRDEGRGLRAFLARARTDLARLPPSPERQGAGDGLDRFESLSAELLSWRDRRRQGEAAADAYLRAGWLAVTAWLATRLSAGTDPALAALGRVALADLPERLSVEEARCRLPADRLDRTFAALTGG